MYDESVNRNFHKLGTLLMLDPPSGLEFGIDNITWKTGDKFKGLKMIPLGTHVITYSLKSEKYMFPVCNFINFTSMAEDRDGKRIHVFRWSNQAGKFLQLAGQQADGYRQGVKQYHFDSFLGAYPDSNHHFWTQNTKFIDQTVLSKLDPIQSYANPKQEYLNKKNQHKVEKLNIDSEEEEDQEAEVGDEPHDQKQQPTHGYKSTDFGGNIYYSEIPRRLKSQSHHTSIINVEMTEILQQVLSKQWKGHQYGILGQLQYSFIRFLIGQCLDSYNQWKQIVMLLCHSESMFKTRRQLMLDFIVVLYEQLQQFPVDFFYDELAKNNFICGCLNRLSEYIKEAQIGKKVISRLQKLLQMVKTRFSYEPCEQEEDEPVVIPQHQNYF